MDRGLRGAILACGLLLAVSAGAAESPPDDSVLLLADEVVYDQELDIVTATGGVEISKGDRVVHADVVSYNRRTRVVSASGHVSWTDEDGNTLFADYVELTSDLKEGAIKSIGFLLADKSRMAAASGRRTAGNRTELNRAVYSPCFLCKEDPTRAPLWQIKAVKVVHDQTTHRIEYQDAWMEIFGVPIMYTPYFSHPDPTVKRASGLLAPRFGISDELGFFAQIPYYWNIAPDKDLTLAPIWSTDQYPVMFGEYRQRFEQGQFRLAGSGTVSDEDDLAANISENDFRGHISSSARFDVDNQWRWGFDVERATDKDYERLYDFSEERTLLSHAYAELFDRRSYGSIQGYSFQGTLEDDDNDEAPFVMPLIDYNFVGEPGFIGSYFTLDANALALTRVEGRDVRRLSLMGGWTLPYTSSWGDIYTISATLQGELYSFNDFDPGSDQINPSGPAESGTEARLLPRISAEWRYPFARDHEDWQEVIEPVVSVVASPDLDSNDVPNEDSVDVEFDDTNLFDPNRFSGIDRLDSGQRVNYGVRWSYFGDEAGYASLFLGQSYQIDDHDEFAAGSGLGEHLSDVVGSVQLNPIDEVDLLYRFRFDANSLNVQRNEVKLKAGPEYLNLDLVYGFLGDEVNPSPDIGDREEIAGKLNAQFDDNWSGFITGRQDIEEGRTLTYGLGVTYQDECFDISTSVARNQFREQDHDEEWKVLFSVAFKNLGSLGSTDE
ncbi:MAG: LPS-assembly protein LptD [Dongiaceae bacterium]